MASRIGGLAVNVLQASSQQVIAEHARLEEALVEKVGRTVKVRFDVEPDDTYISTEVDGVVFALGVRSMEGKLTRTRDGRLFLLPKGKRTVGYLMHPKGARVNFWNTSYVSEVIDLATGVVLYEVA